MYWSGRIGTESVFEPAQAFAVANGLVTLEMALAKGAHRVCIRPHQHRLIYSQIAGGAVMPVFTREDDAAEKIWIAASTAFAQGARGDVSAFIGRPLRVGNVYEVSELPLLKANLGISSITERAANNPSKSNVVFSRSKKVDLQTFNFCHRQLCN